MEISFSFFKQLLELLTSDWRSYLNDRIKELKNLALKNTDNIFLKEEYYNKIALIRGDIKKGKYPWYVLPFNKIEHASLLLTNIHVLELDYLNQNTVKAVKNMLRNNFKHIYNPEIYIIADYEEPIIRNYTITDKIAKGRIITFEDLNIKYEAHTNEELQNFHQNLDALNFVVSLQEYDPKRQPKDYKSFINIKAITWNKFLVKYQKLFDNLSEEHSEILFSICSDNEDFVKSLVLDSISLDLEKQTETVTYAMDKYVGGADSCHITRLFNICNDATKLKIVTLLILNSISLDLEKRIEILKYVTDKYKDDTDSICHITTQLFNICKNTTKPEVIKDF